MQDYEIVFRGLNLGQAPYCVNTIEGLGSPELRSQEIEISNEDGISFGREYFGARKWTITGSVKSGDPFRPSTTAQLADAWDAMSTLVDLWSRPDVRVHERDLTSLTFKRPGRVALLVYGRPERIDPDMTPSYNGHIPFSAIFRQSDPNFYDATETVHVNALTVPYSGGMLLNPAKTALLLPFTTTAVTQRVGSIYNSGGIDTWPVFTINGPVLNPKISIHVDSAPMWEIQLKTSIVSGQSITIDTRPWMRSVTRSDGANVAGAMRGARLNEMVVPPGFSEFIYDGQDATATTTCEIRFRNAWAAI